MGVKHFARYLGCVGLYYSGVVQLSRHLRQRAGKPRVVILAYHSFSEDYDYLSMAMPPWLLYKQAEMLRRTYAVKTLGGLLNSMQRHQSLLADTAVITVDDGYADNYAPLLHLMREYEVPSSVFLTTNYIDQKRPTTVFALIMAIHHAEVEDLDLRDHGLDSYRLTSHAEKESAIRAIDTVLRELPPDRRRHMIDVIAARCGVAELIRDCGKKVMLTWEQAREMLEEGIEIGAHTRSHPVLSRLHPDAAREEIQGSMRRVREKIGCGVVTFAYPYGGQDDISDSVIEACRQSGVACAVTLSEKKVEATDRFALPRMMVTRDRCTTPWGSFSPAMWACELEGLLDPLRALLAGPAGQRPASVPTRFKGLVGQVLAVSSRLALVSIIDIDLLQVLGQLAFLG